ncbi:MAG: hypothetical protein OEL53_12440 [Rhodospirillales bacterium]|nr:hypothetical protein [Rhodospirillales bacterium]
MVNPPPDEMISSFPFVLSIDTCSVWNVLCSKTLHIAARIKGRHFVLAEYVRYECLVKPSSRTDLQELRTRLQNELGSKGCFSVQPLTVDDLVALSRTPKAVRRLHHGELAAIALAQKLQNGFLTDDQNARQNAAGALGNSRVRTTSHLVGWLVYEGQLSDGDIPTIINEHKAFEQEKAHLEPYIQSCYEHAMGLRLRERLAQ